ncbi:MAG: DUF3298 and DUF4163 domain-containing protein [Lachnospiraceae bacterium]|nr:DUF3298 and DUF4163 domain-containing protein [Lachnospiraceae bacterium]
MKNQRLKIKLLCVAAFFVMVFCSACSNQDAARAQITFEKKEDIDSAEDGKILYTSRCVYPVVTMEGKESVAEKINAAIRVEVDTFLNDTSIRDYAEEDYRIYLANQELSSEYGFFGYYHDFDMIVTRNDCNVVSFYITVSSYMGGAHGGYYGIGLNFNAQTGERIHFSELGENAEAFHADTLAYVKMLAATDAYQSIMWEDDSDLEQILYQHERWYLSTSGLVFFSNPYELGGFYAGNIEFTVPYADLKEMGFKEEYFYQENLTIKLQTEESCFFDLNGNGREEEIQFYIEKPGSANTNLHFIIDGTDYGSEHTELSGQFSDHDYIFCWTQCFLYDMDAGDDMTEIAFQMNCLSWEEGTASPYTFLYRYEKEGSLTYLGKMEGTVTNPISDIQLY